MRDWRCESPAGAIGCEESGVRSQKSGDRRQGDKGTGGQGRRVAADWVRGVGPLAGQVGVVIDVLHVIAVVQHRR